MRQGRGQHGKRALRFSDVKELTARVLRGRCLSYGEGITFWPIAEAIRAAAGIGDGDAPEDARGRVDALVGPDELRELRDLGVRLAIDDFGKGYSSLAYLHRFDIDLLKIDQAFVASLETEASETALCEAIIVMAHKLGLRVVAEGIETLEELTVCKEAGCHLVQGWYVGKPVRPEGFGVLVASWMVKAAGRQW